MDLSDIPALKRLIPSLRKRRAELAGPKNYRIVKREGALFLVNYADWADRAVVIHGQVEREQANFLLREIRDRRADTFLDGGAHMGVYAITIAQRTDCGIVAFEPDPRNFAHLQANLLINNLVDRVAAYPLALSDRQGDLPFIAAAEGNLSKVAEEGTSSVRATRLDAMLDIRDKIVALKLDVEGHEASAIEGMRELLRNNDCVMQIECFPERWQAFEKQMMDLGYRCYHSIGNDHYFSRA